MIDSILNPQRDFSAGEIMPEAARRDDTDLVRSGCKRLENVEILTTGGFTRRPGLQVKYMGDGRLFKVNTVSGVIFDFRFTNGTLAYYNNTTGSTQSITGCPWTTADLNEITISANRDKVYVAAYRGDGINMRPQVLTYDEDAGTWSRADFDFLDGLNGTKRVPFHRFAEKGVTVKVTGDRTAGSTVTLNFSFGTGAILRPAMLNSFLQIGKSQLRITAILSNFSCTALVIEDLPPIWSIAVEDTDGFSVGDVVECQDSGAKGQVLAISPGAPGILYTHLLDFVGKPTDNEKIVGPRATSKVGSLSVETTGYPVLVWTEQFISDYRGWPGSVSYDRNRLIFSRLPHIPPGVLWSAAGEDRDFFIGANAADAMLEKCPGNETVIFVTGGPDEFVFTDKAVYFIPISAQSPLVPGSVQFTSIGNVGSAGIPPVQLLGGTFFVSVERNRVLAIRQTGSQTAPYGISDTGRYHSHLIKSPVSLAARDYGIRNKSPVVVVVNSDHTVAYGSYNSDKDWIGYAPWSTTGRFLGVSADPNEILFHVQRNVSEAETARMYEFLSHDVPLDGAISSDQVLVSKELLVNGDTLLVNGETLVIEEVKFSTYAGRSMHVWHDDAYLGYHPLSDRGLLPPEILPDGPRPAWVGFIYSVTVIPFTPNFDGGQSQGQRLRKRKVNKFKVSVLSSQSFTINDVEYAGYVVGDDDGEPMPLRTGVFGGRLLGRASEPVARLSQTWPGRLTVTEFGMEVTS